MPIGSARIFRFSLYRDCAGSSRFFPAAERYKPRAAVLNVAITTPSSGRQVRKACNVRRPLIASLWNWNRKHIFIACFPKSGSTYLSKVLQELTGYPGWYAAEPGEQKEQDLSERRLHRPRRPSIMQQHMRATQANLELLVWYRMRPIVQTRNLFDIVASLHDHFEQHGSGLSCGYISQDYLRMAWQERVDYLIHLHLPWYFNFLLSWRAAADRLELCHVTYEELFANQASELRRIADFYGIRVSNERIVAAIKRAAGRDTRFNVGISGRGAEMLNDDHKHAIYRLAEYCRVELDNSGNVPCLARRHPVVPDEQVARR